MFGELDKLTWRESVQLLQQERAATQRILLIEHLYPGHIRTETGRRQPPSDGLSLVRPADGLLREAYEKLVLAKGLSMRQMERTGPERELYQRLKDASRKQILRSVWIGRHCIDLFVPNLKSESIGASVMRGLAIEVDGDVHNYEGKMRKDHNKVQTLFSIGVAQATVLNTDLSKPTVLSMIQKINVLPTLDSRERRRLWRRIYLITLALNLTDRHFNQLFSDKGSCR